MGAGFGWPASAAGRAVCGSGRLDSTLGIATPKAVLRPPSCESFGLRLNLRSRVRPLALSALRLQRQSRPLGRPTLRRCRR